MEMIGLMLFLLFWPTSLIVWLVAGYFASRQFGRPARIVRNIGVVIWLTLVMLICYSASRVWLLNQPLADAAYGGDVAEVRTLLARGANPDTRMMMGEGPPAIIAATNGHHTEIVRVLVEYGADINAKDFDGHTALQIAEDEGSTDIVKVLEKAETKKGRKRGG